MFNNKYRIVTDEWSGFEVQVKRWWFPFWLQFKINTWSCIEDAQVLVYFLKRRKFSEKTYMLRNVMYSIKGIAVSKDKEIGNIVWSCR